MALISCPDCNKDVSDRAEKCLNCGAPINPPTISIPQPEPQIEFALNEKFNSIYESEKKSPASAVILAFIFGPFGTFYASVGVGCVMCLVYLFSLFGSFVGILIASIVNMFICYFFANESNEKLKAKLLIKQGHEKLNSITNTETNKTVTPIETSFLSDASNFLSKVMDNPEKCPTCNSFLPSKTTICPRCNK
jgi:hypothetical protein